MSSMASMNLSHFPFTFSSAPEVASVAEMDEELARVAAMDRPLSSGVPTHTLRDADTEAMQGMVEGDCAYEWEDYKRERPSTGKVRGKENRLSSADCKNYKFWVMEAMLPWDKSRDIMCNGHNHWPTNLMCRKGTCNQEKRGGSVDLQQSAISRLQPQAVQQYRLSGQDQKLYTVWNCPGSKHPRNSNCDVEQLELHEQQSIQYKAKRNQMQGILEACAQCELGKDQKIEMDPDVERHDEMQQSTGAKEHKHRSKTLSVYSTNYYSKRSALGTPSANSSKAMGSRKLHDSAPGSPPPRPTSNPIARKPGTAPERRSTESSHQWIGGWDDSPAVGFSPWSADDEVKAERGYELCSYMRQISDPMGGKRKDPKRKAVVKKKPKSRRVSARSRRVKGDAAKQFCKPKKPQPKKDMQKVEMRASRKETQMHSPGESAECNETGECEGDEAFGDNNTMDTPEGSGASESEHEEDASNFPNISSLSSCKTDITNSLTANSTIKGAEDPEMHPHEGELANTNKKINLETHTQVLESGKPPCSPSKKGNDAAQENPILSETAENCPSLCDQPNPPETSSLSPPQDGPQLWEVLEEGKVLEHQVDDGAVPKSETRKSCSTYTCERAQEIGIIRRLKGQSGQKVRHPMVPDLSQVKQGIGDEIMSGLPPRPSSQPNVPTFEPLKLTPRTVKPPQYTSRPQAFPSLDLSPPLKTGVSLTADPSFEETSPVITNMNSFTGIGQKKEPSHSKSPCAVQCRKIELPIQQDDEHLAGGLRGKTEENSAQGAITFAPFSGRKTSRCSQKPEKPGITTRKFSSKGSHPPASKLALGSERKERSVIQTRSWDFSMGNQGAKSKQFAPPALSRTCLNSHSTSSKSIGDCIDLLWQHLPSDSVKGFSRAGHEVICKTISKVLDDDRFLEVNEMWSKFATKKESLQAPPAGVHPAAQVMPMNGIKGMLLHLARAVHRAGLTVDWDVLHCGLANGLKEQLAQDVVSNGRSELSWPSIRDRTSAGPTPEKLRRLSDHQAARPKSVPEPLQAQQYRHTVPEVLLAGRRSHPGLSLSKESRIRNDNSFVVLLPLPSARTDEHRWQHRTRGSSSSAPAVPANTTFRILRKIASL